MKGNIFTHVQMTRKRSNTFDLSHDRKFSCNPGRLIPILVEEALPGDAWNLRSAQMIRFSPLVAPIMHKCKVYVHYFYVPNRILWPKEGDNGGWESFITGGEDGTDTTVAPFIEMPPNVIAEGSLADYMGIPPSSVTRDVKFNALPFAAYGKIFNEYYRDQNLVNPVEDKLVDGDNGSAGWAALIQGDPLYKAWQHDYFTSALPSTQKGPAVTIPLGTSAPLTYDNTLGQTIATVNATGLAYPIATPVWTTPGTPSGSTGLSDIAGVTAMDIDVSANHTVDLSGATAASIIDFRRSLKLQEWLERRSRTGARYAEVLESEFDVRDVDARLNRPEFLGGSSSPVRISEVIQTSGTNGEPTPQGNMAGHGVSVGLNRNVNYFVKEHGWIIGIMFVVPKSAYQQGLRKHYKKFDRFDYFWESFAHIGEQAILNEELYITNTEANDLSEFGYTERYAEYKFINSSVHGEFRSSLDHWHWSRIFTAPPALNAAFIRCNPDTRIWAVTDQGVDRLYCQVEHDIKVSRKMPYFSNPYL